MALRRAQLQSLKPSADLPNSLRVLVVRVAGVAATSVRTQRLQATPTFAARETLVTPRAPAVELAAPFARAPTVLGVRTCLGRSVLARRGRYYPTPNALMGMWTSTVRRCGSSRHLVQIPYRHYSGSWAPTALVSALATVVVESHVVCECVAHHGVVTLCGAATVFCDSGLVQDLRQVCCCEARLCARLRTGLALTACLLAVAGQGRL